MSKLIRASLLLFTAAAIIGSVESTTSGSGQPLQPIVYAGAQLIQHSSASEDPYANGIPAEAVGTTLQRDVSLVVGTSEVLDFTLLFPNNPPMTVFIDEVDPILKVQKRNGGRLDASRTTDGNVFRLVAPSEMPNAAVTTTVAPTTTTAAPSPAPEVGDTNQTTMPKSTAAPTTASPASSSALASSIEYRRFWKSVSPAKATIKFTLGCDGNDYSGVITVRIHPYTFVAPAVSYRSIMARKGDKPVGGPKDAALSALLAAGARQLPLSVYNPIERRRDDLTNSKRLAAVTITSLPTNKCRLFQSDGTTPIDKEGTNVTDPLLHVVLAPPSAGFSDGGSSCEFSYVALTRRGYASNIGTVTLAAAESEKPKVYSTNVYFRAYEDTTRPVEFFVNSINPPSNYTWTIVKGPKYGELYDVDESAFTRLTAPLAIKPNEPFTAYAGPENRLVLFYKLNAAGIAYFKELKQKQNAAEAAAAAINNLGRKIGRGRAPKRPSTKPQSPPRTPLAPQQAAPAANGAALAATISDSITFTVRDAYDVSSPATVRIHFVTEAGPICGTSNFPHTFWDKPLNNLLLNYTVPSNRRVQRIILTGAPKDPIGDLYYRRSYAADDAAGDGYEEDDSFDDSFDTDEGGPAGAAGAADTIFRITKALRRALVTFHQALSVPMVAVSHSHQHPSSGNFSAHSTANRSLPASQQQANSSALQSSTCSSTATSSRAQAPLLLNQQQPTAAVGTGEGEGQSEGGGGGGLPSVACVATPHAVAGSSVSTTPYAGASVTMQPNSSASTMLLASAAASPIVSHAATHHVAAAAAASSIPHARPLAAASADTTAEGAGKQHTEGVTPPSGAPLLLRQQHPHPASGSNTHPPSGGVPRQQQQQQQALSTPPTASQATSSATTMQQQHYHQPAPVLSSRHYTPSVLALIRQVQERDAKLWQCALDGE